MAVSLDKVSQGIQKYCAIMERLRLLDVSQDIEFQRMFNSFYKLQRHPELHSAFYSYLENHKYDDSLTFESVLVYLYNETGVTTPSFSSKLLATVRPDMPVWDTYVIKNLGLKVPTTYDKQRIKKTISLYEAICYWYRTEEAKGYLDLFNTHFDNIPITDTKKIDLILWQTR